MRPEAQGIGFGRQLFGEARRLLHAHGLERLVVWSLVENAIGCRFYRALGGEECGRSFDRICGVNLAKIGFLWT